MHQIPTVLQELLPTWLEPQEELLAVVRWSRWENKGEVRRQNTLQHTHSILFLAATVLPRLVEYGAVKDQALILSALLVHDHGEGILKRDVLYDNKTIGGDVDEYKAFVRRNERLPTKSWNALHRAFLLQFAHKDPEDILAFPLEAQVILEGLEEDHAGDALIFSALEHLD